MNQPEETEDSSEDNWGTWTSSGLRNVKEEDENSAEGTDSAWPLHFPHEEHWTSGQA